MGMISQVSKLQVLPRKPLACRLPSSVFAPFSDGRQLVSEVEWGRGGDSNAEGVAAQQTKTLIISRVARKGPRRDEARGLLRHHIRTSQQRISKKEYR